MLLMAHSRHESTRSTHAAHEEARGSCNRSTYCFVKKQTLRLRRHPTVILNSPHISADARVPQQHGASIIIAIAKYHWPHHPCRPLLSCQTRTQAAGLGQATSRKRPSRALHPEAQQRARHRRLPPISTGLLALAPDVAVIPAVSEGKTPQPQTARPPP